MKSVATAIRSVRRESDKGYCHAANWFLNRYYYRVLKRRWQPCLVAGPEDAKRAMTVVVPAVEKDTLVLSQCLRSVRSMIQHHLHEIWVVAPESAAMRELASAEGCRFMPENDILPRPAAELGCRGWILQQLIKFNVSAFVTTPDYLVLDADTVFLRPQVFFRSGKSVLRYSDQYELLYSRSLELVFKNPYRFPVSFVTHHMLFNVKFVRELLALITQRFGRTWWEALLNEIDKGHPISLSEYELYGHFVMSKPGWRNSFCLEYWHGLDRDLADAGLLDSIRQTAAGRINTVSFHRHTQ